MTLTRLEEWELRLDEALADVDRVLEKTFSSLFPLRPNRPAAGSTSNPKYDGLFTVTAKFSLGLTSGAGASYIVDIRTSTFRSISNAVRQEMLELAHTELQDRLDALFPGSGLRVVREDNFLRIVGDLDFC